MFCDCIFYSKVRILHDVMSAGSKLCSSVQGELVLSSVPRCKVSWF